MSFKDKQLDEKILRNKISEIINLEVGVFLPALYQRGTQTKFSDFKFLLADHNQWLYCYIRKGGTPTGIYRFEQNPIARLREVSTTLDSTDKHRRGMLLEFFSNLELLVDNIIQLHLIGLFPKNYGLTYMLLQLDYEDKLISLKEFNIITKSQFQNLNRTRLVRNQLAHHPDINSLYYSKNAFKLLNDAVNMQEFKEDLVQGYKDLVSAYIQLEKRHMKEIDELINKLRDLKKTTRIRTINYS
ncbi:MAG: hypothetical protein ACPKQO_04770 [Nitrososphaeraceae archaeon]